MNIIATYIPDGSDKVAKAINDYHKSRSVYNLLAIFAFGASIIFLVVLLIDPNQTPEPNKLMAYASLSVSLGLSGFGSSSYLFQKARLRHYLHNGRIVDLPIRLEQHWLDVVKQAEAIDNDIQFVKLPAWRDVCVRFLPHAYAVEIRRWCKEQDEPFTTSEVKVKIDKLLEHVLGGTLAQCLHRLRLEQADEIVRRKQRNSALIGELLQLEAKARAM